MALTIIDSDILIEASRGKSEAIDCLVRLEKTSRLAISVVTQLELIIGCRDKIELRDLEKFLKRYEVLRITDQVSDKAIEIVKRYYLSHGLLIPDGLIAATALIYNEPLISRNRRDFRFVKDLNLLPYP